jgi:flagellin
MTVINTNVAATVTAQAMKSNQRSMETTMERLATGLRVNTAADDAAGLAIGTKMDSQIRGFEQAVRNANDGISMLQTADGAAEQITGLLQRMRELAVQGQNDTNSASDKDNLNEEFIALATEIDRIANDTQFNGINLLNSNSTVTVTVGADEADTIDLTLGDFNLADGATSTKGLQTITFSAVSDVTGLGAVGAAANAEIILTDSDGNTLSIDQTQIAASLGDTSSFSDATVSNVATAINTALGNNTAFGGTGSFTAVATSTTTITFEQTVAGTGSLSKVALVTHAGVSDVTSAAVTQTTAAGTSTAAAPMGSNLGTAGLAYDAAGDHVEASGTIAKLDAAIQGVNTARADFGSKISRLGYTIDNLNVAITNTASAKSSIVDADYAKETTELARTQIIAQAATAMLSQANQQQQSVLALLK